MSILSFYCWWDVLQEMGGLWRVSDWLRHLRKPLSEMLPTTLSIIWAGPVYSLTPSESLHLNQAGV